MYVNNKKEEEPQSGSIILNKIGLDSGDVAGFTLYDSNGAVGGEKRITGNGQVSWSNLPLNEKYAIVETTVPDGYNRMSNITGIVINSGQLHHNFVRNNTTSEEKEGKITVLAFTGMPLAIPVGGISSLLIGGLLVLLSRKRRKK